MFQSPTKFSLIAFFLGYVISFFINPLISKLGLWNIGPFLVYKGDRFADLIKVALSYRHIIGNISNTPEYLDWPQHYKNFFINNPYMGLSGLDTGSLTNLHLAPGGELISLMAAELLKAGVWPNGLLLIYFVAYAVLSSLFVLKIGELGAPKTAKFVSMIFLFLSWPAIFAFDRGNYSSLFVTIFIALYIVYLRFSNIHKNALWYSLIFFALAVSIRPNTAIFFWLIFLSIPPRLFINVCIKSLIVTGSVFLSVYLMAHMLYPDYSLRNFLKAYDIYKRIYEVGAAGDLYNNSIYFPLKYIGKYNVAKLVSYVVFFVGLLTSWAYRNRNTVPLFVLCLTTMLCTPVFADYHMLIFFAPITFTLAFQHSWHKLDFIELCCLLSSIVLISPKNYFDVPNATLSSFINPILGILILLFLLSIWIWSKRGGPGNSERRLSGSLA